MSTIPYLLRNPALDDQQEQPLAPISASAGALPTIRQPVQSSAQYQPNPQRQSAEDELMQSIYGAKPKAAGFWPKAARVLEGIGNAAGTVILGNDKMGGIPGTAQNKALQQRGELGALAGLQKQDQAEENTFGENQLHGAQTKEADARADALENPAAKPEKYTFQQTDHGLMRIDSATGEAAPVTFNGQPLNPAQKPEAPKGMEHIPLLGADGKPMIANYHPDTGKYTDQAGNEIADPRPVPPPPNYGQLVLPTKTATYLDAKGIPTEFQWNEQSKRYDIPVGQSATGGYGHEAAQAGAVERAGTNLIQTLEANRKDLGTLGAWVAKYGLNTPIADPKLAGLQAQMVSFAALNPAMHGSRGLHAMEHFERLVGGLQQNPDASIEGIRGILKTAGAINPGVQEGGNESEPVVQRSPSTGQYRYSTDGGKTWQAGQPNQGKK